MSGPDETFTLVTPLNGTLPVGDIDGAPEGETVGKPLGDVVGLCDGFLEGTSDGSIVGALLGSLEGADEGRTVRQTKLYKIDLFSKPKMVFLQYITGSIQLQPWISWDFFRQQLLHITDKVSKISQM